MTILLLGGNGQVGSEILGQAKMRGLDVVAPARSGLDITSSSALERLFKRDDWSVVINAAAYTNVDGAEENPDVAFQTNAVAPTSLAELSARRQIPIVHISTDYVFGGDPGAPYTEEAPPSPVNCYGESKLEGEIGVRANNPRHAIVRTAWVHSPFGSNFVKTILKLAGERDELSVVSDQRGNPTSACEVARACLHIANEFSRSYQPTRFGTYHFCGSGEATWFDFARAIIQMAGLRTKVRPIRTADYRTAAVRAADTRLNCDAIKEDHNLSAQPWRLGLQDTLARLNV